MRDAVQYMWVELVEGLNDGKTVWELMRDIQIPEQYAVSQGHGKVSWSVRATHDIVAGWYYYDTIANMYHVPVEAVHGDLVDLIEGGADALARRAREHLLSGRPLEALRLLDVAKGRETESVLRARIEVVEQLLEEARDTLDNYSEVGLLEADLRETREKLERR